MSASPPGAITIPFFGIAVVHEPEFIIDRPQGNGEFIFIHFQSPIYFRGVTGDVYIDRNAAVLYTPEAYTWYSSVHTEMQHTWFHCYGDGVAECIERFELPVNQALRLGTFEPLVPFLKSVRREQLRQETYWEDAVSLQAHAFFLDLGRAIHADHDPTLTAYRREMRETLRQVRVAVHSEIAKPWSVGEMASLGHLSSSRFTALYAEFFGRSPHEDLLEARLRHACSLLRQTIYPVERIAEHCGFVSVAHFSRMFRQKIGSPPSRYREER